MLSSASNMQRPTLRPPLTPAMQRMYQVARQQFRYFDKELGFPAFMENAGGSQVPQCVIEAIAHFMQYNYVQLQAGYPASTRADATIQAAHDFMSTYMNAAPAGHVAIGPSTSQMLSNLGDCYARVLRPGDEVIVQEAASKRTYGHGYVPSAPVVDPSMALQICHEANAGPWVRACKRSGATLRWWEVDPETLQSPVEALGPLLGRKTRVVALAHVSNLLGEVTDVEAVVALVHSQAPNARVVVDGVAYTPHLALDVQQLDVDWYAFSNYKVWGPHTAVLYGKQAAFRELAEQGGEGLNHYWIPSTDYVYKTELGGLSYESCAGIVALQHYLQTLCDAWTDEHRDTAAGGNSRAVGSTAPSAPSNLGITDGRHDSHNAGNGAAVPSAATGSSAIAHVREDLTSAWCCRDSVVTAYDAITAMEQPLQQQLLEYLAAQQGVEVFGPNEAVQGLRVPTVSFVKAGKSSQQIASQLQQAGFALRHGHNYAHRLASKCLQGARGRDVEDGVVRISLLHYNTVAEVNALLGALDHVL